MTGTQTRGREGFVWRRLPYIHRKSLARSLSEKRVVVHSILPGECISRTRKGDSSIISSQSLVIYLSPDLMSHRRRLAVISETLKGSVTQLTSYTARVSV